MDFNEIKKIKININQSLPKKQENIIKSDDNNIAYEHNNSPVDPLYWQKTSGINNQDISFGSSEKSNLNDSEFIDECITKIKFFAYSVNKTPDEEYFRQTLQNILPLGKEAVELYVNMVCYLEYDKKNDNSEENIKKENISDFVLRLGNSPDQIKKLNYLSMPNFLTTETMSLIINNDCEQIDTETIKHIIDELYKDKSKADIINLLSSDKNITNADITNKDILNVLQFKFDSKKETQNDSQLFMKVLESLKQKIEKNDSVFC